jgi:hypothetical protein
MIRPQVPLRAADLPLRFRQERLDEPVTSFALTGRGNVATSHGMRRRGRCHGAVMRPLRGTWSTVLDVFYVVP